MENQINGLKGYINACIDINNLKKILLQIIFLKVIRQ